MGVNSRPIPKNKWSVIFVIIDNNHLTTHGVDYFIHLSKNFLLVTANKDHPAFGMQSSNLHISMLHLFNDRTSAGFIVLICLVIALLYHVKMRDRVS
ncbi:hypothetical protein [Sporolactobacillus laevolacticus]|uniref:hypothetical protein n=1 Tax=Sporolactobacillus laevolacticus TaxID=33018 RepID=UPI0012687BE6|nr:hypothetical protein [Sporolactobacillus laevolacticus]